MTLVSKQPYMYYLVHTIHLPAGANKRRLNRGLVVLTVVVTVVDVVVASHSSLSGLTDLRTRQTRNSAPELPPHGAAASTAHTVMHTPTAAAVAEAVARSGSGERGCPGRLSRQRGTVWRGTRVFTGQ
jgi:hypothetical protein